MDQNVAPPPPQTTTSSNNDILLYFIAIFIPPLAVYFTKREFHADLLINIALWFLGWIPGTIHAWWIISKN